MLEDFDKFYEEIKRKNINNFAIQEIFLKEKLKIEEESKYSYINTSLIILTNSSEFKKDDTNTNSKNSKTQKHSHEKSENWKLNLHSEQKNTIY